MGIQMMFAKNVSIAAATTPPMINMFKVYRQGIITELLNPKTALFFLSFLPQFVKTEQGSISLQMFILGSILVFTALSADLLIAVTGGTWSRRVVNQPLIQKIQNMVAGTVLIALGVQLACGDR